MGIDKLGDNIYKHIDEGIRKGLYSNEAIDSNIENSLYDFVFVKLRNKVESFVWDEIFGKINGNR